MRTKHMFLSLFLIVYTPVMASEEINEAYSFDDMDTTGMVFEFNSSVVRAKEGISLLCDEDGFLVREGENVSRVNNYDTDPIFKGRSIKEVIKFSFMGKYKVSKFSNGEYAVEATGGLNGGGPITAAALYWITKSSCWAGVGAGATIVGAGVAAATAASGGAVGAAIGGAAGAAATVGVGSAAGTAGTIAAGAALNAGVVTTAGAVSAATSATVVGAGLGGAGVVAGTIAGIEGASAAAFLAGMALPLP